MYLSFYASTLLLLYPILYGFSVYFESKAYMARNAMRTTPAQAYNKHQKLMFWGRFGPLFGLPIIGLSLDNQVSQSSLALALAASHIVGFILYQFASASLHSFEKRHLFWMLGIIIHVMGMHLLFISANNWPMYRATILMLSTAVNGLGTFFVVYFVEHGLAKEFDGETSQAEFESHQMIRSLCHFLAGTTFLTMGIFF